MSQLIDRVSGDQKRLCKKLWRNDREFRSHKFSLLACSRLFNGWLLNRSPCFFNRRLFETGGGLSGALRGVRWSCNLLPFGVNQAERFGRRSISSIDQRAQNTIVLRQYTASSHNLGVLLRDSRQQGSPCGVRTNQFRIRPLNQTLDHRRQRSGVCRREKVLISSVAQPNNVLFPGLVTFDGLANFGDDVRHMTSISTTNGGGCQSHSEDVGRNVLACGRGRRQARSPSQSSSCDS